MKTANAVTDRAAMAIMMPILALSAFGPIAVLFLNAGHFG